MTSSSDDHIHYNAVRKALANGNAAVMVGAGFSKNAENGEELAMWHEIAQELWRELNPNGKELSDFSASTVTQLGEQYARVFSKPGLEELLKRLIPDERVAPGVLHRSMMSLPWTEIFTTNYDTLLERTAETIVDKAYYTVMCREDIPQSKILGRRRIVKLHGSFPSQRPFIFTEEDYRRYPEYAAPFINLVRQSMLENVFCLIGFSGEDPNFLHWIGWVRDVLDEHALPIYLFVSRPPGLGVQRLLESRRVTSVVLPMKDGVEEWDYAARFTVLFEILKRPLRDGKEEWGSRPAELSAVTRGPHNEKVWLEQVVTAFEIGRKVRGNYPGWFVAPHTVRKRFFYTARDFHGLLYSGHAGQVLSAEFPHVGVTILAEYSWHQEVMLQCMNDELADLAMRLLSSTASKLSIVPDGESVYLRRLGADSPYVFKQRWKELALAVLRWSREALRQSDYDTIRELVLQNFPTDLQVIDQIAYEDILLQLYSGDRDVAQQSLKTWDVRSPDSYMLVRKGMLLGELGEVTSGLKTALEGLKRLRRNQRSRSNSTLFLSQEAWACLAIGYLNDSLELSLDPKSAADQLEYLPDELTQRLSDLAAAGHDVRTEVLLLTSDLNAETPAPSLPITYAPLFELGRYSTIRHLGPGHSYSQKIQAAFSWLTLSDRVSLVPRVGNATFDIGSFGQAAWWVQYADSMQRVLSVMVRLLNSKMLEPRQHTHLIHSSGWLSRYQVAKTPEVLANQLCLRSMKFLERMFPQDFQSDSMEHALKFHVQVLSRLIIRIVDPGFVVMQLAKVVQFYKEKLILMHPSLWEETTNLIVRCFEALPPKYRLDSVPLLASIPDRLEMNVRNRFHRVDWLDLNLLRRHKSDLLIKNPSNDLSLIVDDLIGRLQQNVTDKGVVVDEDLGSSDCIWSRLFWIKEWGGISKIQISKVEELLFSTKDWPIIPGHHSWAALSWLFGARKRAAEKRYKRFLLKQGLEDLSTARPDADGKIIRSWGIRDADRFLSDVRYSLSLTTWTKDEIITVLLSVKSWWDGEWEFIKSELVRQSEIRNMFVARINEIDQIFASLIDNHSTSALTNNPELVGLLDDIRTGIESTDARLFYTDIALALDQDDRSKIEELESQILLRLFEADIAGANYISKVISYWTNHSKTEASEPPSGLMYSLAGVVSARKMPVLPWALNALTELADGKPEWITASCYSLINVGLKIMLSELSYTHRPDGSGIPDDSLPVLRFGCVQLAQALKRNLYYRSNDACGIWLGEAANDPLPELRFMIDKVK